MACLAALITGCADPGIDREAEAGTLMELSRQWSAHISSGDVEAGMAFWADDALMLPPDFPILEGKQAIRQYVEGALEVPGFRISWEPIRAHVSASGDLAYLIERNVMEADGPDGKPVVTYGKAVTIWSKGADGTWRNIVDTWNAAPPPAD
jgi:ketosteroid isomerase-like protein